MPERRIPPRKIVTIEFCGHHTIDLNNPPKNVNLEPHTMLDLAGNDTGIPCSSRRGTVSVIPLLDPTYTGKVMITCNSASSLGDLVNGARQCMRAYAVNVK